MSLKQTETVYNLVIDHVIKEITDDPQLQSISTEALEYLGKTWRTKLQDTGVFTPPNTDYQKHLVTQHHLPILRPAMPDNYLQNMAAAAAVASSTGDAGLARMMMRPPGAYGSDYVPDPGVWLPPYYQRDNRYNPNIQFDAKPMLTSGAQPYPQQLVHQQMMGQMGQMQANQHMMNMGMNPNQQMQMQMQMQKKEPAKNTINIKAEPNRDEEEQANNSKVPTKVPVQGPGQGLIDISTPKRSTNNTEVSTPLPAKENEKEQAKKAHHEEEKKDNVFHSEEDDDHEHEDDNNQEEEEDDARLFEYDMGDKGDIPQPKEEHIPPPLQQGNAIAQVPLNLSDLDPYNPQDRPLDSDDDPDYGETPETTDILIAFHEKVHRHGTKWKVTLKQGIMNAKGKEYILSQITGDFDFILCSNFKKKHSLDITVD